MKNNLLYYDRIKLLVIAISFCALMFCFWLFIVFVILDHLGDWTMAMSLKYLIIEFHALDSLLIIFFPILNAVRFLIRKNTDLTAFIKSLIITFFSVSLFLVLGFCVALITWKNNPVSPFLPEYIRHQPFPFYWTIFILVGILLPSITLLSKKKSTRPDAEKEKLD